MKKEVRNDQLSSLEIGLHICNHQSRVIGQKIISASVQLEDHYQSKKSFFLQKLFQIALRDLHPAAYVFDQVVRVFFPSVSSYREDPLQLQRSYYRQELHSLPLQCTTNCHYRLPVVQRLLPLVEGNIAAVVTSLLASAPRPQADLGPRAWDRSSSMNPAVARSSCRASS